MLSSCKTSLYTPAKAKSQQEAASTHLAVLSVTRWEDCKTELQPKFTLSAEAALAKVLPDTMSLEEKFLNAFAARLKVALPGSTFSSTDLSSLSRVGAITNAIGATAVLGTNGVPQSTASAGAGVSGTTTASQQRTNVQTFSSGDASAISFESNPQGSNTAADLPGAGVLTNTLGKDAMLQYWTAAALYQEVKLISRYVDDAAIATNYVPYLVRLQVSLMPRMRNLPYDAHTLLSFFGGRFKTNNGSGPDRLPAALPEGKDGTAQDEGIKVLPLLVTDNLEATLHSRSVENIRQLALGLSAVIQGVGLGVDLQKVDEELRTVLGRDYNSTFSVGRVSDNTVQCRFGALNQATAQYAMIPQAHNVSLVVLVPRKKESGANPFTNDLRVVSKTELVHALSGKSLPSLTRNEYYDEVKKLLERESFRADDELPKYRTNKNGTSVLYTNKLGDILGVLAANDFERFGQLLEERRTERTTRYFESIWIELCRLRNNSQLGSVEFQIPSPPSPLKPGFFPADSVERQTILTVDNGKVMTASLQWLENIRVAKLGASMELELGNGRKLKLAATAGDVQEGGRFVRLAFPSPAALGHTNTTDGKTTVIKATLNLFSLDRQETLDASLLNKPLPTEYRLDRSAGKDEKAEASADKLGFAVSVPATVINAHPPSTNGVEGAIDLIISGKTATAKIQLEVDKAGVVSVLPEAKVKLNDKLGWELTENGNYTVQLRNLNLNEPVQITVRDTSGNAGPVVKTVRVQAIGK